MPGEGTMAPGVADLPRASGVADPADPGMLDVVGFDSAAPEIISSFAAGRI